MDAPFPCYSWLAGQLEDVAVFARLYQSITSGPRFPTLADFVEAQYPGYAQQALPEPPPVTELPDGSLYLSIVGMTWSVRTSKLPGCSVAGLYLASAEPDAVSRLVVWVPFPSRQKLLTSADWIVTDFSFAAQQLLTPSA